MNVIIPVGGKGERFLKNNYSLRKPLIDVYGKPMIINVLDNLNFSSEDNIYIIYYNIEKSDIENILFKYRNVTLIQLNYQTKGSVETVLFGLKQIIKKTNYKKTIVLDCDTVYTEDILSIYKNTHDLNAVFYTKNYDIKPLFSYIIYDLDYNIIEIQEKQKISDNANTGAYCFNDINILYEFCDYVIKNNICFNNEHYMSCVINEMIKNNNLFKALELNQNYVFNLGTPEQLIYYTENIFLFLYDLDGTLIKSEHVYYKIWSIILNEYNIKLNDDIFEKYISGNSDKNVIDLLIPNNNINVKEISKKKDALFIENIDNIELIPGVINMLEIIKKNGHKLSIVTNCNRNVSEFILEKLKIKQYFDHIIIGNECLQPKPHPSPYITGIERFNSSNKKAIIFEDSKTGLLSAHSVSPRCIIGIETNYSSQELVNSFANITMKNFLDFDLNTIVNYNFYENNTIKKLILKSLHKLQLKIKSIDINDTKLKGGFISDVIDVTIQLNDDTIINCVAKLENKNENSLSIMSNNLDLYKREYYFYKEISNIVPINIPKFFSLIYDDYNQPIGILLENLNTQDHILNLDLNNEDINVSLKVIDSISKLHSKFWNKNIIEFQNVKKHNDKLFNPHWYNFIKSKWNIFKEKWYCVLNLKQQTIAEYIYSNFLSIQQKLSDKNLTFCHGDVKSGNIFYKILDNSYQPIFIDWQYISLGKGVQDLVFFMIESFNIKKIKYCKSLFKDYYYIKLIENGIDYSREEYDEDFIYASYYFPFFVAIWFGTLNEDELIDKNFPNQFIKRLFNFYII